MGMFLDTELSMSESIMSCFSNDYFLPVDCMLIFSVFLKEELEQ